MTLNKRKLKRWGESMWVHFSKEQEREILERFGEEPEPYEWSEQDIFVQIRNYIGCGEFVKSMIDCGDLSGQPSTLPPGVDF